MPCRILGHVTRGSGVINEVSSRDRRIPTRAIDAVDLPQAKFRNLISRPVSFV